MNEEQLYETLNPTKEEFDKMLKPNLIKRFFNKIKRIFFGKLIDKRDAELYEAFLEDTQFIAEPEHCIYYNVEKHGCNLQCSMPSYPRCRDKTLWLDCEKFKKQNAMNKLIAQDMEQITFDSTTGLVDDGTPSPLDHMFSFHTQRDEFVKKLDAIYSNVVNKS